MRTRRVVEFRFSALRRKDLLYACHECGAAVADRELHGRWHNDPDHPGFLRDFLNRDTSTIRIDVDTPPNPSRAEA